MSLTHGETFVIPNIRISTMMCVRERAEGGGENNLCTMKQTWGNRRDLHLLVI
jgi:hypothetical protein